MFKKISVMLLAAIINCCCMIYLNTSNMITAGAANADNLTIGDVDSNDSINALDAASILSEAVLLGTHGVGNFTEDQLYCADVNSDGQVNAIDASVVLSYTSYTGAGGTEDFAYFLEHRLQSSEQTPDSEPQPEPSTPEPVVPLTDDEKTMLAALVTLEVGSESYDCQKAVASLVINRMLTSNSTLSGVIYEKNQFSVASKVASTKPFDSCVKAVNEVLTTGTTLPIYVTFFRASYYHSWGDQVAYCCIGNTYFSYSQALKNKYA